MDIAEPNPAAVSETAPAEPLTKSGLGSEELRYFTGGMGLAAPSVINTSSKYLNDPYYRDAFAQVALRRAGTDVPTTYTIPIVAKAIGAVTDYGEFARLIEEEKAGKPEFAEWLRRRRHTAFRIDDMAGYAPGTLGHHIWNFLASTGYEMDKLQLGNVEVTNDIDYVSQRRAGLHDLEHMVTGFRANQAGEVALLWVNIAACANYFSPALAHHMSAGQAFLATAALTRTSLHYREAFPTILEAVQAGIAMGRALKRPFMMEPWEDMLDWQLDAIVGHFGLTPGPGDAWEWTNDAMRG
jgi:ubiquinone biosynthesis protein Coq4